MQQFEDIFPNKVPPLRGIEHHIDLIPGTSLPNKPACRINPQKTEKIQKYIPEIVSKDGTWGMYTDCWTINNITIKYMYLIYRLDDLLDELFGTCIFLKIELKNGYHRIKIRDGNEWKITFKTKYGLYEWMVMPIGLTNAPITFMRLMNHVLR